MRRIFIALACFAAACSGDSPTGTDGPLTMTQVYHQKNTGIRAQRGEVISRESRWSQVWDEINSTISPKPPLPTVNWDTQMLVLAARGETADACKDVEIERVERQSGELRVSIAEKNPGANCGACPPVVVHPVHVVAVPRAATGARFDWHAATANCP